MKVLSIKQPWAELILQGKKKIEIRKWNTKFRGLFLIHASGDPDREAMKRFGFSEKELPLGKIVGKVFLVDVKDYRKLGDKEFEKDKNKHLAGMEWGNFGFILENVERVKPINVRGKLGFWEFDLLGET
jgi:hypothetical protein